MPLLYIIIERSCGGIWVAVNVLAAWMDGVDGKEEGVSVLDGCIGVKGSPKRM